MGTMRIFAVAAVLALAGCGFPEPKVAVDGALPLELPYREAKGGLILLAGRVNGKADVDFILDTGAPVSVILDGKRTAALGIDTSDAKPLGDPSNPGTPVGVIRGGMDFRFGPVAFKDLTAVVVPDRTMPCRERFEEIGFAGVIGADLFRRFVVEIDTTRRLVRLHDPKSWQPRAGASVLPISFRNGHPHVDVTVKLPSGAEVTESMNVDIGMNRGLTLAVGGNPAFVMPPPGATPKKSCYVNGVREERVGEPVSVALGETVIAVEAPNYSDYPNAVSDKRVGSIGASLFQGRRVTIDYPGKRLVVG
jgi:hypothetical protein